MAGGRRIETGRLNITVRNGVDVNNQRYGDAKGSIFEGLTPFGERTVLVDEDSRSSWTIMLEDAAGKRKTYTFNYEMLIGRTQPQNKGEVKLVLENDGSVSGRHCKIYEMGGRLVIMDMGSKNHTYLNGMQIMQPTELSQWGQIQVGKSAFRVVYMAKN